jgi:hypothetical protein
MESSLVLVCFMFCSTVSKFEAKTNDMVVYFI